MWLLILINWLPKDSVLYWRSNPQTSAPFSRFISSVIWLVAARLVIGGGSAPQKVFFFPPFRSCNVTWPWWHGTSRYVKWKLMTSLDKFGGLGIDSHLHILGWWSDPRTRISPDFSKEIILPHPKGYKPRGKIKKLRGSEWKSKLSTRRRSVTPNTEK